MRRICIKAEFQRELEDAGDRLVAVDFVANWCTKSNHMTSRINDLMYQTEFSEVVFLQVNVDDNEDTPAFCEVDFLPTVQFYRYGKKYSYVTCFGAYTYLRNRTLLRSIISVLWTACERVNQMACCRFRKYMKTP